MACIQGINENETIHRTCTSMHFFKKLNTLITSNLFCAGLIDASIFRNQNERDEKKKSYENEPKKKKKKMVMSGILGSP